MFKLNNATQGEPVMSCDELVNCVHSSSMSVCLCLCSCLYTFRCMVLMMHRRLKCCRCRWVGNFTASIDILHCMVLTDFTVQEPSKGHLMHCISIKVRWRGYDCCRTIARSCVCVWLPCVVIPVFSDSEVVYQWYHSGACRVYLWLPDSGLLCHDVSAVYRCCSQTSPACGNVLTERQVLEIGLLLVPTC